MVYSFLNNLKIQTKLVLIYIICVIIPIIFTNSVMFYFVSQNAIKEQKNSMEMTIERLKYNLEEQLRAWVTVSNHLYTDPLLNDFLQKKYKDGIDYYNKYITLMQGNVIRYYYTAQSLYNIEIYTKNASITNGGAFWKLKDTGGEEWYQKFKENNKGMVLLSYYNENRQSSPIVGSARTISLIRYLDYFNPGSNDHILKIDLDYGKLLADVVNEVDQKDIFVCQNGKIIFSTMDFGHSSKDFYYIDDIDMKEVTISNQFSAINDNWDIIVSANSPNIFDALKQQKYVWFFLIICNLLFPTIIIILLNKSFRSRIRLTEEHLLKVEKEVFEKIDCYEGKDEIGNLIRSYNLMVVKIKELIEVVFKRSIEKQELEVLKKQAELNALQNQVNPHFLYNTLESIRMRCLIKGEEESGEIIGNLAVLMRRMTKWEQNHFVTIEEEIEHVERYLQIQKYRFADRLQYSIHVEEECYKSKIPKFGITTFVENACIHGIEKKVEGGSITVIISTQENQLYVEIMDSGIGIKSKRLEKIRENIKTANVSMLQNANSTGILNAYMRIKMYYHDKVDLYIDSTEEEGTEVCLVLPLI